MKKITACTSLRALGPKDATKHAITDHVLLLTTDRAKSLTAKAVVLAFASALLAGCGDDVEVTELGKLEKPAEHDQAAASAQAPASGERQVVVPAEVQKKFAAVTLTMKRRADAKEVRITQKLGETRETEGITLTVRDYLPAFVIQGGVVTSDGSAETNPAVWVEAREGATPLYRGWLFRDYPELNPPQDPAFEIRLIEALAPPQK